MAEPNTSRHPHRPPFPGQGDALLVVDVQNDFLPGGRLPVPEGDATIPALNRYLALFRSKNLPVAATCDRHPPDHCSFSAQGGRWPPHCVAGTSGADFPAHLDLPRTAIIAAKATEPHKDAYSGFEGTGLADALRNRGVARLFVGGLATDYCVLATVRDALAMGFEVVLLTDAIRAVDVAPGDGRRAENEMLRLGAIGIVWRDLYPVADHRSALLTDWYQLSMMQAYLDRNMTDAAVFELYIRTLPQGFGFFVSAGLESILDHLEQLRFSAAELHWLAETGSFNNSFLDYLSRLRFTGAVDAVPEGTVLFPGEPAVRITASLPEAQLLETRLINLYQYQTLVASKAARAVLSAEGRTLVDFGLRRAHGAEAGWLAARSAYLAGFSGTSDALAAAVFGIPLYGTMSHAFVQAHASEAEAFAAFAHSHPGQNIWLLDTYDTEAAAELAALLAGEMKRSGVRLAGVRLDSGDLAAQARRVREILDRHGLAEARIFASGNLDERGVASLVAGGAPVDGFGIGTRLVVGEGSPSLDCVYKLQEYAGAARMKWSEGKSTRPGRKQIFRRYSADGKTLLEDILGLDGEPVSGEALLEPAMRNGRRVRPPKTLERLRESTARELSRLPEPLKRLDAGERYPVRTTPALEKLSRDTETNLRRLRR